MARKVSRLLSNIRIVLVETTHAGNIGAVARAMKNMSLEALYLVAPRCFPDPAATARAAGAHDVLNAAVVCDSLIEAIEDCHLVIGASARIRTVVWPQLTPRACAEKLGREAATVKTAILFGREQSGLTNAELERCSYLLHIPSNPAFSSLNVAAAVQVVAYELYLAAQTLPGAANEATRMATAGERERFYEHLRQTLFDIGFFHQTRSAPSLMRRLKRLFHRARLEQREINILRGILAAVQDSRSRRLDNA
jgi:tRNA (cytidine32/uridine32-2'-O)-methyltransferase